MHTLLGPEEDDVYPGSAAGEGLAAKHKQSSALEEIGNKPGLFIVILPAPMSCS